MSTTLACLLRSAALALAAPLALAGCMTYQGAYESSAMLREQQCETLGDSIQRERCLDNARMTYFEFESAALHGRDVDAATGR